MGLALSFALARVRSIKSRIKSKRWGGYLVVWSQTLINGILKTI